jgi:hypothetical protein
MSKNILHMIDAYIDVYNPISEVLQEQQIVTRVVKDGISPA